MTIQNTLQVLQLLLAFANLCILAFAFVKFLGKPHDTLEIRVTTLEGKIRDIEASLRKGNDRFSDHDRTNEVIIKSVIALLEFEIQYCLTEHKEMSESLTKAKNELHEYLSRR